jgi:hypothetical protein
MALFRFKDEPTLHQLTFHLLPTCIHNVILGKPFLKATETFSNAINRLRRVTEKVIRGITQFHFLYLGASGPEFEGSINGIPQTALADTGSKVPIIDEDWARSIGLRIQPRRERLRFADDSYAYTSGMAYGIEWKYGVHENSGSSHFIDFHVLKNAPANVILYDAFLFDTDAFSRYQEYLIDDADDDDSSCYAIDIDSRDRVERKCRRSSFIFQSFKDLINDSC